MPKLLYWFSIQSTAAAKPGEPDSLGPMESMSTWAIASVLDWSMPTVHIFLMTESADRNVCAEAAAGTTARAANARRVRWRMRGCDGVLGKPVGLSYGT